MIDQFPAPGSSAAQGQHGDDLRRQLHRADSAPDHDDDADRPDAAERLSAGRGPLGRPLQRARGLAALGRLGRRRGCSEAGHEVVAVLIDRDGRWTCDGRGGAPGARRRPARAATSPSRSCTARSARTARCRACSSASTSPTWAPTSSPRRSAWTSSAFKRLLAFHGHPPGRVRRRRARRAGASGPPRFGLPLWVKPSRLGSSVGISKVTSPEQALDEAVELAARHDPRVIVEASADGREVECSVLGNEEPETSLPGEIVAHADWYDYEAKYSEGGMELVVPAPLEEATLERVRELAAAGLLAHRLQRPRPLRLLRRPRTARCWSTRSTRSPASPRPASTRSSSRPAGSATRELCEPPASRLGGRAPPSGRARYEF